MRDQLINRYFIKGEGFVSSYGQKIHSAFAGNFKAIPKK